MHFKRLVQLFYQILLNLHYFNCSTYFSFFFLPVTVALMEILWPWLLWLRKIMDGGHGSRSTKPVTQKKGTESTKNHPKKVYLCKMNEIKSICVDFKGFV